MSDESQVTCPECQTSQSARAPFCENCGYRIRRSDTVKEGHHVVTPQVLRRAREKRLAHAGADDSARPDSAEASFDPADGKVTHSRATHSRATGPRATDSKKTDAKATGRKATGSGKSEARPGDDGAPEGPHTYIEGLHAVDLGEADDQTRSASASAEFSSAASQSALLERPAAADSSGKLAIYMTIWLALTAVAILATYFLTTRLADDQAQATAPSTIPERVTISEGAYLRGLAGDVRSFILQMCQKVEDDPKETCKEKKLLKGEYPEESVELAAFEIDATEVTVASFEKCVGANACTSIDYKACQVWTHQGLQIALRVPKALQEANRPVTCATLAQAKAYCQWAGGKLPSSDQWEKAARGTKGKLFPWGTSWSSEIANWGEMDIAQNPVVGKLDGFEWTAPSGSFPEGKSPFGAYDMAGNVAEWVDTGKERAAVARGGSWTSHPFDLRVTHRLELEADARRTDVGFRCAYD